VGTNGATLVNVSQVGTNCAIAQITVWYDGDTYYNSAKFTFPQTNPPISSAGGGGQGQATVTPQAHPTATASATITATATSEIAQPEGAVTPGASGGLPLWPIAAIMLALVALAGGGAFVLVARRTKVKFPIDGQSLTPRRHNRPDRPTTPWR
jgi:hypothetical protein